MDAFRQILRRKNRPQSLTLNEGSANHHASPVVFLNLEIKRAIIHHHDRIVLVVQPRGEQYAHLAEKKEIKATFTLITNKNVSTMSVDSESERSGNGITLEKLLSMCVRERSEPNNYDMTRFDKNKSKAVENDGGHGVDENDVGDGISSDGLSDLISETATYDPDPHGVGDRLLDAYPDRNLGETKFAGIGGSQNTPAMQAYYDELRSGIFKALNEDNFRNGHFKDMFHNDRSILSITLDIQMSGEISKEQFNVLFRFGRGWSRAIGESANWAILDDNYIEHVGLWYAIGDLMDMFEQEKENPLPYPLPDELKYIDPKTWLEKYGIAAAYQEEKVETPAGYVSPKRTADIKSAKPGLIAPVFSEAGPSTVPAGGRASTLEELGITKEIILATLAEYSAATSLDRVLRNAWNEINNIKGPLNNSVMEKMSDGTVGLIYRHIQTVYANNNIPMPLGQALDSTIARLEAVQIKTESANPRSGIYDPLPSPTSRKPTSSGVMSKVKKTFNKGKRDKKGKGKAKDDDANNDS